VATAVKPKQVAANQIRLIIRVAPEEELRKVAPMATIAVSMQRQFIVEVATRKINFQLFAAMAELAQKHRTLLVTHQLHQTWVAEPQIFQNAIGEAAAAVRT